MNTVLLIASMVLAFGILVAVNRMIGESGVIGFMAVATILANIMVCKSIDILGFGATLGNVMFACNFLATDILTECYGVKSAQKGVLVAICSAAGFLLATQIMLMFTPNVYDFAQESMKTLFSLTPRITLASVSMFALSNYVDIRLYEYMRKKSGGKRMWLRNNLCTMLCNGSENFLFYTIAFVGVMGWGEIVSAAITATIIEIIIALADTPFLYAARKYQYKNPAIA